ncbi:hypothetical protein SAMN05192588_2382 [Nonlabens sp. Hel1_33_55]|uniref:hypothetical protein n=1 Tax=Nonlabens sp. Hel1_33_55 TaxID=1336802 RepID=UPI000875D2E4|nr:hypothetical protein [Nonlabens sp. Hel1_33_55]SCY34389.1 hypothetical protein SAMN05192588_2382 [Nonlabens sp. Hel1_33_55]
MKKKIAADLTSLAHRVLQIKDKDNVQELQAIAKDLYEKLTVLVFTEKHFSDIKPTAGNREVQEKMNLAFEDAQKDIQNVANDVEQVMEEAQQEARETFSTNDLSDLFVPEQDNREIMDLPGISTISKMVTEMPEEEPQAPQQDSSKEGDYRSTGKLPNRYRDSFTTNSLNDLEVPEDDDREEMDLPGIATINKMITEMPDDSSQATQPKQPSSSKTTDLEQLTADFQTMPVFERKSDLKDPDKPQSLNSKLNKGLKIGMNDRMGFEKHLFNGNSQDFNRVLSQLNTITSYDQAQNFIQTMIKPDYNNWEGKESYENRFLELIERKFQ